MSTFPGESELERSRQKVLGYAVENPVVNVDHFFNNLRCAAKLNLAFGLTLKNMEDGEFRYFYAHKFLSCWIHRYLCAPRTT